MRLIFVFRFITILFTIIIFSCNPSVQNSPQVSKQYYFAEGFAQGTTYHITYQYPAGYDLQPQFDSILGVFNLSLSIYEPKSVISRINRNDATVIPDSFFTECFRRSMEVSEMTGGAFDITVAPLVNAWGFGYAKQSSVSDALIDSLRNRVGYRKVKLENNKLVKEDPRIMLDCNAIAQGYAVDVISRYLELRGSNNYLVEIGGEVRAKGVSKTGEFWRIGIDKPIDNSDETDRELQAIVHLENRALATSGNYRKFYEKNGVKYSHTIDPFTGFPVNHNLLSATVIAGDCTTADAFATACMVLGVQKGKELIAKHPEIEVYFIYNENGEYREFYTEGLKKMFVKMQK